MNQLFACLLVIIAVRNSKMIKYCKNQEDNPVARTRGCAGEKMRVLVNVIGHAVLMCVVRTYTLFPVH